MIKTAEEIAYGVLESMEKVAAPAWAKALKDPSHRAHEAVKGLLAGKSGKEVFGRPHKFQPLDIIPDSHVDHGVSPDILRFLKNKYGDREGFFIDAIKKQVPKKIQTDTKAAIKVLENDADGLRPFVPGMANDKERAAYALWDRISPKFKNIRSGLYGPAAGDNAIPESMVHYKKRGDRENLSRMIGAPMRPTDTLTVIAGPAEAGAKKNTLYTAFGGPSAMREVGTPGAGEAEAKWWAQHALSTGQG